MREARSTLPRIFWSALIAMCSAPAVGAGSDSAAVHFPQYLQDRPATRLDEPTQWVTCSWDSRKQDPLAECATVLVPLDYAAPARGDFRVFVKRRKFIGTPSAQVWILHGGPGASATEHIKQLSHGIAELRPDIAYYAVDHRGAGGSERLECPQLQRSDNKRTPVVTEKWPECIAYLKATLGTRLESITATNAARDVGTLIEKYRLQGVPVFVYGASYGTYLARRYMHLFPQQARGVIIEGIVNPADHFNGYDGDVDRVVGQLLDACEQAPACGTHFEEKPAVAIRRALSSLDRGHCPALQLTTAQAKNILAGMTYGAARVFVPALARRIARCSPDDVVAVKLAAKKGFRDSDAYSPSLLYHVALSEQYHSQDVASLQKQFDEATLSLGLELAFEKVVALWPRYPRPSMVGHDPKYSGPLLMLQGGLDPPTSLQRALPVRAHFKGPKQYWVEFPEGSHGLTSGTPTRDGGDCARSVYLQFIDRPDTAPDTRCIRNVLPINWNSTPEAALGFMGTIDIWDGAVEAAADASK